MRTFKPHFHAAALLILLTAIPQLGGAAAPRTALPPNLRHLTPILGTNPQPLSPGGDAPNCWNWALYVTGGVQSLHFTDSDVFESFLNSSFCRRAESRSVKTGQIGVIKTYESDTHLHAFYTLSATEVLTRTLSFNPATGAYEVAPLTAVRSGFHRPLSDPRCQNITEEQSVCGSTLAFYSCRFPPDSALSPAYTALVPDMKRLEALIQDYFLNRSRQPAEIVRAQEELIRQKLLQTVEGLCAAFAANPAPNLARAEKELLRLRLQSLFGSLLGLGMPQDFYPKRAQLLELLK